MPYHHTFVVCAVVSRPAHHYRSAVIRATVIPVNYNNTALNRPFHYNGAYPGSGCTNTGMYYNLCFGAFNGKHGNYGYG